MQDLNSIVFGFVASERQTTIPNMLAKLMEQGIQETQTAVIATIQQLQNTWDLSVNPKGPEVVLGLTPRARVIHEIASRNAATLQIV